MSCFRNSAMHYEAVLMEPLAGHIFPSSERPMQNLQPSDRLSHILQHGEDFYHTGQQTNKMLRDHARRRRISHDNHRKALVLLSEHGPAIKLNIDMLSLPTINPFEVTLTMQIHEGDYGIIYKRSVPDSLTQIMKDTETLIRFPDRGEEGIISCQVSVKGTLGNVERARSRLRALTTLVISFPAENDNLYEEKFGVKDLQVWLDEAIRKQKLPQDLTYEVVPPQRKQIFEKPTFRVSGALSQEDLILKAVSTLRKMFHTTEAEDILLITEITVPASQLDMFMGGDRAEQLVAIARSADVYLHFLPPSFGISSHYTEFRNFIITGRTPRGVMQALKIMISLQPVQLSFEVCGEDLAQKVEHTQIKKIFDDKKLVHIHICPSLKQFTTKIPNEPTIHFVCMTTQEHNMGNVYMVLRTFLRKELGSDNEIPCQKPPGYITAVSKSLQVTSRSLDIQNCEFPDMIMTRCSPSEKGDVLLLEKSDDLDDMDSMYSDIAAHSSSNGDSLVTGFSDMHEVPKDLLGFFHVRQLTGSIPHELIASRSDSDNRFDVGHAHTRGYYNNKSNRGGRRPSGNYVGDKRNNTFLRNRYNKDREFGGKNDFPRNRPANESDRNGPRDESKQGRYYSKRVRNALDDNSLSGYIQIIHPKTQDWRRTQDKVILLNKKTPGSHNSTMDEENDFPKRMNVKDLIDKATEELSSGSANTSSYSDNSRVSYARMVGGNSFNESSETGNGDTSSKEKGRRRSYSSSESNKHPLYGRDSPFAAGMRQLDRRVDVDHVLFSINCDKYLENFRKAKIVSLPMFQKLEEEDLMKLGVNSTLDRNTILSYIQKLRDNTQSRPGPAAPSRSAF